MGRPRKQPATSPGIATYPRWLILVTDGGTPRLFSAHYTEDTATTMRDSLDGLTAATVTLIEVPEAEGIVKADPREKPQRDEAPTRQPRQSAPARAPYRAKSEGQIEAETARALNHGESVIISGVDLDDDARVIS